MPGRPRLPPVSVRPDPPLNGPRRLALRRRWRRHPVWPCHPGPCHPDGLHHLFSGRALPPRPLGVLSDAVGTLRHVADRDGNQFFRLAGHNAPSSKTAELKSRKASVVSGARDACSSDVSRVAGGNRLAFMMSVHVGERILRRWPSRRMLPLHLGRSISGTAASPRPPRCSGHYPRADDHDQKPPLIWEQIVRESRITAARTRSAEPGRCIRQSTSSSLPRT